MSDKTALGISEELRHYIEALVEEVILEGKSFENYKKYLSHFCQAEGINYGTLETHLSDFFEIVEEWKTFHTKGNAMMAKRLGEECYITETFVENLLNKIDEEQTKKEEKEQEAPKEEKDAPAPKTIKEKKVYKPKKKAKKEKKVTLVTDRVNQNQLKKNYPIPVRLLWLVLGAISIAGIVSMGWCGLIPLCINLFVGILTNEKMENEKLTPGFIFRGGLTVVVAFLLTYFFHWWSLLLTPIVYSFVLTNDDIEG